MEPTEIYNLIDLERYPLDDLGGTLSLFRGHYSMHRVTQVAGRRTRTQAILSFSTTPGLLGNLDSSILHYGPRVADIEEREH